MLFTQQQGTFQTKQKKKQRQKQHRPPRRIPTAQNNESNHHLPEGVITCQSNADLAQPAQTITPLQPPRRTLDYGPYLEVHPVVVKDMEVQPPNLVPHFSAARLIVYAEAPRHKQRLEELM